jgi:mono/diheme cytochrome c family protein
LHLLHGWNPFSSSFPGEGEHRVKTFVWGVIAGTILVPLCGFFYFGSGAVPVATSAPPMPFERMLAHKALDARIAKEMPTSVPIQADDANLVAGAQVYRHHCAVCHGLPGQPEGGFAKGMFPHPPKLTEGKGVTDDEPGETYWKVANGIRLTGMPSFHQSLSETEMWQVSLLAAHADKLPQAANDVLSEPMFGGPPPGAPGMKSPTNSPSVSAPKKQ